MIKRIKNKQIKNKQTIVDFDLNENGEDQSVSGSHVNENDNFFTNIFKCLKKKLSLLNDSHLSFLFTFFFYYTLNNTQKQSYEKNYLK